MWIARVTAASSSRGGHDLRDQAECAGFRGIDDAAGEQEVARLLFAYL